MSAAFHNQSPADARAYSLSEYGYSFILGEHFTLGEFASRDGCDIVIVHPVLVELLEKLRQKFGVIHVNSGYRTPIHNARIGGKLHSYHILGMAADIVARKANPDEVGEFAVKLNVGGVGFYKSFTHVDIGKSFRRW